MKQIIAILLLLLGLGSASAKPDDAMKLLDKSAAKLSGAKAVYATFTLTSPGSSAVKGEILFSGKRYFANTAPLTTWFDGKTQWSYSPSTSEVNIIEPSAEDLAMANPFAIISSLRHNFTATYAKSAKGSRTVSLTAKRRSDDIRSALITLSDATLLPTSISATMADGTKLTISIGKLELRNSVDPAAFTFPKARYPKARINDMR